MSIREQLHRLVDVLPEAEAGAALRFLEYPRDAPSGDEVTRILMNAPKVDEPFTDDEQASIAPGKKSAVEKRNLGRRSARFAESASVILKIDVQKRGLVGMR